MSRESAAIADLANGLEDSGKAHRALLMLLNRLNKRQNELEARIAAVEHNQASEYEGNSHV